MKLAIVQRVLASYRVPLYRRVAADNDTELALFSLFYAVGTKPVGVKQAQPADLTHFQTQRRLLLWVIDKFIGYPLPSVSLLANLVKWRPDCIAIDGLSSGGTMLLLVMTSALHQKPIIWWSLGKTPVRTSSIKSALGDLVQRCCTKRCVAIIAYGTHSAKYFEELGNIREKIFVAHNTIDEELVFKQVASSQSKTDILSRELNLLNKSVAIFSGTINKGKKLDILLRSLSVVVRRSPHIQPVLVVIGDGPDLMANRELAHQLGLDENVRFVGRQDKDVSAYFLLGRFAVLPGLGGLAINHSFAHGLAVVCGPADGCELDLVHQELTGLFIERITVESLADALERLFVDEKLCRLMGLNARTLIEKSITMKHYASTVIMAAKYSLETES